MNVPVLWAALFGFWVGVAMSSEVVRTEALHSETRGGLRAMAFAVLCWHAVALAALLQGVTR